MDTKSEAIRKAVEIAVESGNSVKLISTEWSQAKQVVYMTSPLTIALRNEIQRKIPSLHYWSARRTPHNLAEEGFFCDVHQVGLSFPCK